MEALKKSKSEGTGPGEAAAFVLLMVILYFTTHYSYLLFHSMAEIFSIVVAFTVFTITWNSRHYINNAYLFTVGISCLFIGILDLMHVLSYKGMAIFTDYDYYANQLWIAARGMESLTLLAAFAYLFTGRKPNLFRLVSGYTIATMVLLASIFFWKIFPECFVEGVGQTTFKLASEYVICTVLFLALLVLSREKDKFDPKVHSLLMLSLLTTIISELSFTFYISNYGISNLVGHYFKIFTFMLIYFAVVKTSLKDPYNLIFRELNTLNDSLVREVEARKAAEEQKEGLINELQTALEEIKSLRGIIPICSYCKNIRNDSGYWEKLEAYLSLHTDVSFSHGICPDCMQKHFPEYADLIEK